MFDPWSLKGDFLYVELVAVISAHSIPSDLSRCSTTHSSSRSHQRDTTPFPSSQSHFMRECSNVLKEL